MTPSRRPATTARRCCDRRARRRSAEIRRKAHVSPAPKRNRHADNVSQSTPAAYTGCANSDPDPNAAAETRTSAIPDARRRSMRVGSPPLRSLGEGERRDEGVEDVDVLLPAAGGHVDLPAGAVAADHVVGDGHGPARVARELVDQPDCRDAAELLG